MKTCAVYHREGGLSSIVSRRLQVPWTVDFVDSCPLSSGKMHHIIDLHDEDLPRALEHSQCYV